MLEPSYLSNQFLIAMPGLMDPNFHHTVTYICSHDADGALGLVINRPLELSLGELLQHLQITLADSSALYANKVFAGGPVQPEQGFVLHTPHGQWDSTLKINDDIGLTTSRDILQAAGELQEQAPQRFLLALGYAGWGAGQLEREMVENAWLSGPADTRVIFDTPISERWAAAAALLGVDLALLSSDAGHA